MVDGFGEVYDTTDATKTGCRPGRQEISFGNDLQVRANVSTNLPSPVFNWFPIAIRVSHASTRSPTTSSTSRTACGTTGTIHTPICGVSTAGYDLPKFTVAGADATTSIDLFNFGWRSAAFANGKGSAICNDAAFLTGAKIVAATGAGFITSQDHRATFGLRHYGEFADIDYDWEGAYQTGSYAGLTVDAFAVNTDTGYTFHDLPWKPRIGAHADLASGGASKADRVMSTYQPMYPNTQYYAPNNEFAPTNFWDFTPRISVRPTDAVVAEFYYSFLWRNSNSDAISTGAPWPGGNGQNSYATTILPPGRAIDRQSDLMVSWSITPHVLTLAEFGVFDPGSAIRTAGGHTTTYINANLTFKL